MVCFSSCAFTGHRPHKFPWKYNENDYRCITLKARLSLEISSLVSEGVTEFYTGMAQGVDTWAALDILKRKSGNANIHLHCIIPYSTQPNQWRIEEQTVYAEILSKADEVKELSHDYYRGCLLDRNKYMVNVSGFLLAIYNGEYRGGTAATIRYAQKLGRRIIIIKP